MDIRRMRQFPVEEGVKMRPVVTVAAIIGLIRAAGAATPVNSLPRGEPVVAPGLEAALARPVSSSQRIWVFFTDKGIDEAGLTRAVEARRRELAPQATARR